MSELVRGSLMPLFDRLVSHEGPGGAGASLLSPDELQLSIAKELGRLFNTRCRFAPSEVFNSTGTVIDYGIPDFSALSPRRGEDRELLEAGLMQAIAQFEPRLKNIGVKVSPVPQRGDVAAVTVSGDITVGLTQQRVSFALSLDSRQDVTQAT